jgi:hypothetical protein
VGFLLSFGKLAIFLAKNSVFSLIISPMFVLASF